MTSPLRDIHLLPPSGKAAGYFAAARAAAELGAYDHAIGLYLAGLRHDPANRDAHQALREVGLRRKAAGGQPLGLTDRLRLLVVRHPTRRMLDAARILAHDPADTDAMSEMLKS